jgi:hypothetical protein
MKKPIISGFVLGTVAVCSVLVIKSESLPFNDYLYESPTLTALFGILNLPVLLVLMATQIDYRPFALSLIFIQWFLIGAFVSWIFVRFRGRTNN